MAPFVVRADETRYDVDVAQTTQMRRKPRRNVKGRGDHGAMATISESCGVLLNKILTGGDNMQAETCAQLVGLYLRSLSEGAL